MDPTDSSTEPAPPEDIEQDACEGTSETLSPAVRRLIRQYDLDASDIKGTGPGGRLRVGDVMAVLGSRGMPPPDEPGEQDRSSELAARAQRLRASPAAVPVTSVFECDMSAVLAHRKQLLAEKTEYLLTSYYIVAAAAALLGVPEVNGNRPRIDIAVALSAPDTSTATPVLANADTLSLATVNETLRAVHHAVVEQRFEPRDDGEGSFLVYHHGVTGSLLATPTPLARGHSASLGIGRIRRQVAVQNVNNQTGPRVAPMCYVSLTFRPERLDLPRANQFLGLFVRRLERWPKAGATKATSAS